MACSIASEPYTNSVAAFVTTSQTFADGPKDSGTAMRLRQLEADHHSCPLTARSGVSFPPLRPPAGKCPVFEQSAKTLGTNDGVGLEEGVMPRSGASFASPAA